MVIDYDPSRVALYTPERGDTVFEAGRSYSTLQIAVEAARLAYYRAEESNTERARLAEAIARVGFGELELFGDSTTGAAGFGARRSSDEVGLISFRGTQPDYLKDLLADADAKLDRWAGSAGRVHSGFAEDTLALRKQIDEWLDRAKPDPKRLIITGHSLGAAIATLAAAIWRPEWLIALGSPRVGDRDFAAAMGGKNIVRLVDCCDGVTAVPLPVGGYVHVGPTTYLTRDAGVVENPNPEFVVSDQLRGRAAYTVRYAWQFWANVPVRDLADHAPINYVRGVFV